jgi:hypothetical protein
MLIAMQNMSCNTPYLALNIQVADPVPEAFT